MLGLVGIILSLLLLMYLAYRGINVLLLAPLLALLAVLFAGDIAGARDLHTGLHDRAGQVRRPVLPAVPAGRHLRQADGRQRRRRVIAHWIVERVGDAARASWRWCWPARILTYGGVSLFVVAFAVFPIAAALFREAGVPKRLIPGAIALGSFTFTMTALPGHARDPERDPGPVLRHHAFAAPGLGIIAALIMFGGGMLWLNWRAAARAGPGNARSD